MLKKIKKINECDMNDCGAADGLLWGLNLRWLYILMEVFLMHAFEFDGTVE